MTMQQPTHDLGITRTLSPEALGEPGERTFRLIIEAQRGTACIWVEKEQLSALAVSITSYLEDIDETPEAELPTTSLDSPQEPFVEFKAARLGLTFDSSTGRFGIVAYEFSEDQNPAPTLVCWSSKAQSAQMARSALDLVAKGRPICPLCHRAIDKTGHLCPNRNGHGSFRRHFEEDSGS